MLVSKVITAILIDFVTAQDLSNEYASQISRKYKQFKDGKQNILNNFDAPASVLKEIDLDLKFAITELSDVSDGLDVEETWGNCRNIAEKAVNDSIPAIEKLIDQVILDIPKLPSSKRSLHLILTDAETSEPKPSNKAIKLQSMWREVKKNIKNNDFIESVQKRIYQKLFKTSKSLFLRGHENIDIDTVKEIIQDKLKEGILEHPDFQKAIKSTQEIVTRDDTESQDRIAVDIQGGCQEIFEDAANSTVQEKDVSSLIQKFSGVVVPHADIMVNPNSLRDIPIEIISSLKIKAQVEGYHWTATESSETLHKAKN